MTSMCVQCWGNVIRVSNIRESKKRKKVACTFMNALLRAFDPQEVFLCPLRVMSRKQAMNTMNNILEHK